MALESYPIGTPGIAPSSGGFWDLSASKILDFATGAVSSFLSPAAPSFMPSSSPGPGITSLAMRPLITGGMALAGGGLLVAREAVRSILLKIAESKGLLSIPSLASIISFARRAAPIIGQSAVAAGLAISAEELATLILAHATRRRRRMNPGNVKALRRSMRRVESFHKLCVRADSLRRGRKSTRKVGSGSTQFVRQG